MRSRLRTVAFGWVIACGLFSGALLSGGNGVAWADANDGASSSSSPGRDTSNPGAATPSAQSGRTASSSSGERTGPGPAKLEPLKPKVGASPAGPAPQPERPSPAAARPLSAASQQGGISQSGGVRDLQLPLSPAAPAIPALPTEPGVVEADLGALGPLNLEPQPITMPPLLGAPVAAEIPLRLTGPAGAAEGSRGFARSGEGSVQRQRLPATAQSGTTAVPESFRVGYPQYLREAKIGEVAVLALPGFAGLLALTALGGFLGYRQARAGHVPRTAGVSRFLQ